MKKQVRIFTLLVAAALAASMLTACQSKEKETYFEENSKGEIVDSKLLEKIEQEAAPLNTKVENYSFHSGKNQVIGHTKITVDDQFLYVYDVIASVRTDGSDLWVKKFEGSIYNQR